MMTANTEIQNEFLRRKKPQFGSHRNPCAVRFL